MDWFQYLEAEAQDRLRNSEPALHESVSETPLPKGIITR